MKHRAKSSKIKYEHKMIHGLRSYLEQELEPLEYLKSIFPARIRRTKSASSKLKVLFKYETRTGAKLLAYSSGRVQEIFVVTNNAKELKNKLMISGI